MCFFIVFWEMLDYWFVIFYFFVGEKLLLVVVVLNCNNFVGFFMFVFRDAFYVLGDYTEFY